MRVQRAPRAAEQPQRPPAGLDLPSRRNGATKLSAPAPEAPPGITSAPRARSFSADIALDLTRLAARLDRPRLLAEIIVLLVEACHAERLIDDDSPLQVVRPSDDGLVGLQLDHAVRQSAYAISFAVDSLTVELPAPTPGTLTVVDLGTTRVRPVGDWGLGGVGVVTLGPAVPTVVSHPLADGSGLSVAQRRMATLGFVVPDAQAQAHGVVRALEAVARSVEQMSR